MKLGFQLDSNPAEEDVEPAGLWYAEASQDAFRYLGVNFIFSYETYHMNPELRLTPLSQGKQSDVMKKHPDPDVRNVYYLAREVEATKEIGKEYIYDDTPFRLIFTGSNAAILDYRDPQTHPISLSRAGDFEMPQTSEDPVLPAGRWSFGNGRPKWTMYGIDGENVTRTGFNVVEIQGFASFLVVRYGDKSDRGGVLADLMMPVGSRSNLFYAATKIEYLSNQTIMWDRGFLKNRPTLLAFTGENKGYLVPFAQDRIPLERKSYWTLDPTGEWKVGAANTTDSKSVFISFVDPEGLTPKLTMEDTQQSRVFMFHPFLAEPNTYVLESVTRNGRPEPAGEGKISFQRMRGSIEGTANVAGMGEVKLTRQEQAALTDTLATGTIADEVWETWIRTDQNPNWLGRKRAATVTVSEGFLGKTPSNIGAALQGYNVLAVDPYDLTGQSRGPAAPPQRGASFSLAPLDITPLARLPYPGGLRTTGNRIFQLSGYNETKDWYMDPDTELRLPGFLRATVAKAGNVNSKLRAVYSEDSLRQSSSLKVGISSGSGQKAGPSASYGQSKASESLNSTDSMLFMKTAVSHRSWLSLAKRFAVLTPQFIQTVNMLPNGDPSGNDQNQLRAYVRFFENWGTHYPISTLFGARATLTETRVASEMMRKESETTSASGSLPLGKAPANIEASYEETSESGHKDTRTNEDSTWTLSGVDNVTVGRQDSNVTLADGNAPIRVQLAPIYELLLPRLFRATTPAEKSALARRRTIMEKAFNWYLSALPDPANRNPALVTIEANSIIAGRVHDEGVNGSSEIEVYTKDPIVLHAEENINGRWTEIESVTLVNRPKSNIANLSLNSSLPLDKTPAKLFVYVPRTAIGMGPSLGPRAPQRTYGFDWKRYRFHVSGTFVDEDTITSDDTCSFRVVNENYIYIDGSTPTQTLSTATNDADGMGQMSLTYTITIETNILVPPFEDPTPAFPTTRDLPRSSTPTDE